MAILGKVDKFNIGKRRMATVCGTVDTFFHANFNDNAKKKRTLLLPVTGPVKMYKLLRDLCISFGKKTYNKLAVTLSTHYSMQLSKKFSNSKFLNHFHNLNNSGQKWLHGHILKPVRPLSYTVKLNDGHIFQRHINHLQKSSIASSTILEIIGMSFSRPSYIE